MSSALIQLEALGPHGVYRSHNRLTITDVTGTPVAELSVIPRLFVTRTMSALHKAKTKPLEDRVAAIARAGKAFATATIGGDVFAVHAAGNHPGVHQGWLEPLALGYRIAVRPSRREPFTPYRLITALREAGFADDQIVLLPTDYDAADEILRGADLGMAYGGDDVVRKYAADTTVLPQGPGRAKILITAEADWESHLDTLLDSVSQHGGVSCVNTTAVLVEGDPTPVARAIAEPRPGSAAKAMSRNWATAARSSAPRSTRSTGPTPNK